MWKKNQICNVKKGKKQGIEMKDDKKKKGRNGMWMDEKTYERN